MTKATRAYTAMFSAEIVTVFYERVNSTANTCLLATTPENERSVYLVAESQ